jgi:hypothetical protein
MTDLPPSDPSRSPRDRDELIAVVVAFAAIGSILAWGLTRGNEEFFGSNLPLLGASPSPSASVLPSPSPTDEATGVLPFSVPQASPEPSVSPADQLEPEERSREGTIPPVVPVPVGGDESAGTTESGVAASPSPTTVSYSDVPRDYWAYPFIAGLTQRGIVTGFEDGTFRPEQPLTRAEYAAQVQQIFDQPRQETIAFRDVPSDFWARSAIDTAVRVGFLRGYPGGVFQPTEQIPRYQVLLSLVNGFRLTPPNDPNSVVQTYQDSNQLPAYSIPAIAAATDSGVVVNYPDVNTLKPNQPATRAEVAAMIYQALVETGDAEPVDSPYIVKR